MISFDAVRAALRSEKPWTELDRLVRAEQTAGRKVRDITEDMEKLSDAVWNASDLSEDGQDAFGDTMDALRGNCHSDSRYIDLPESTPSLAMAAPVVARVDQPAV